MLRLRPGKQRREVRDGGCPGLRLVIQVSGYKSWALRFRRPGGQSAKLTLGPVDLTGKEADGEPVIGMPLTLLAARRLANDVHRQRAMGKDVVAVRHREKLERAVRGGKDFAQAAIDFIEQHAMRKTRRWRDTGRMLGLRQRTHVVPLSPSVRELIASVPTKGDLVFTLDGKHPVAGWSKIKNRLDAAMKIPPWRLHDLRRTCATGMAEIGIAPHIVEAVLNHVSGARAGVAGTYNRAAYAAEKKAALERWAAHVEGLISGRPAKVVSLRKSASAEA
jgi:Arm DNA-binding domain